MPRALKSFGSQEDSCSVIAAFRKWFLAVRPENSNFRGLPRGEESVVEDSYRAEGMGAIENIRQ